MRAFAIITALILVTLIVVGAWRDWWGFDVSNDEPQGTVEMRVSVDKDRVREDADKVVEKSREALEAATVAGQIESIEGTVTEVEESTNQLTVDTDEGVATTFHMNETTELTSEEGTATRADLQPGTDVMVSYRESDGRRNLLKVKIMRP